jgi:hypothetical protein
MHEELTKVIAGGVAAIITGVVGYIAGIRKDRSAQEQKITEFLIEKKLELDSDSDLLEIVNLLKKERVTTLEKKAAPSLPEGKISEDLRDLPAFLEPIGIYLEYNPATFVKAYGIFAEEVLLCADSNILWVGDDYRTSAFWRSFAKFVSSTKGKGYSL